MSRWPFFQIFQKPYTRLDDFSLPLSESDALQKRICTQKKLHQDKVESGVARDAVQLSRCKVEILDFCLDALNNHRTLDELKTKMEREKAMSRNFTVPDGRFRKTSTTATLVEETVQLLTAATPLIFSVSR